MSDHPEAARPTIFALSSGQPPAAIAVIRISGPAALAAARALIAGDLPPPRRAGLRRFIDPETRELLDEGLLLTFPGEKTETGEDMVELHCHGSHAVVRDVQAALARLPGLRLAHPGEFTRRAFLNGRIDLAAIEGLGDLLAAETAYQRRAAVAMMGGALSRKIADWTATLRRLAAQVEAQIDFSDEGDVGSSGGLPGLAGDCEAIARAMEADLARPPAERLKDGVHVAIGGPPNAGKSSLFNVLVGREAAIVSPHAGTTRDLIDATISIGGLPFRLSDSAGIRNEAGDDIERIGIDRATAALAAADIILWLGPAEAAPNVDGEIIQIRAKADLEADGEGQPVSARTGLGVDALLDTLLEVARGLLPRPGDYALSQRQRAALARASAALREAADLVDEILIAECLRQALGALDELTGKVTTDAVLDELFAGFCIGK